VYTIGTNGYKVRLQSHMRVGADRSIDYSGTDRTVLSAARVSNLTVAVVGLGALGGEVVKNLALAGTGHLVIIDPDTISPRNLTRSVFFRQGTVGRPKAKVIADVVRSEYRDTRVTEYTSEVADVGAGVLGGADIWFSCVHSQLARMEIAALATSLRIPVIDGAVASVDGAPSRVTWFAPDHACYSCMLPAARRREILSLWEPYAAPCGGIEDGGPGAISPAWGAVIAGLQVELGMRNLFSSRHDSMSWHIRNTPRLDIEPVQLSKADLCPFHWPQRGAIAGMVDTHTSARSVLAQFGETAEALVLEWPICVRARCNECDFTFAPMQRVALFRRSAVCPQCSSSDVLEMLSIATLGPDSPYADLPLAGLGIPAQAQVRILGRSSVCV
jgi:adenylyltransferase/sulfurtransferase